MRVHNSFCENFMCKLYNVAYFRSPAAEFLVGLGPSKTWLVGNALVTITTSGTGGSAQGVCPRCQTIRRSLKPDPDILLASNESYDPPSLTSHDQSLASEEATPTTTLCSCWCRGWAEIKVRRPTGNVSWLMRIQNKLDILATPQPSANEYDWSLLGLNKEIILEEEEEEEEESEWGILTMDPNEDEEPEELVQTTTDQPFHSTINQSHDESHDKSHDKSHDDSHGKSHDESHDQTMSNTEQSHDHSERTLSDDDQLTGDTSHDQSHDQSHDSKTESTSKRQPSSHSWSERGVVNTPVDSGSRSYSLSVPMESLPPLFSYDEGHLLGRSPSLVTNLLSDPEQVIRGREGECINVLFIYF